MSEHDCHAHREDGVNRREFLRGLAAGAAAGALAGAIPPAWSADDVDPAKIRNHNPEMEYRRLGKTGVVVSAVCMGGHWKRLDKIVPGVFRTKAWRSAKLDDPGFQRNRYEVVTRAAEVGINYIDACTPEEVMAYGKVLEGRRELMHLGFSWHTGEMRNKKCRTTAALLKTLEDGLRRAKLEYVDLWRITMLSRSSQHTEAEIEQMMVALQTAKQQGKCLHCGLSSHDRLHIKHMIETYPEVVEVFNTPFTAKSKERPTDSLFETVRQHNVGVFGIKPFASNSLFKGDSTPGNPHAKEDDDIARLTIRYILATGAVTAPIPGLITTHQVDNVAQAVRERRQLARHELERLERAGDEMHARLPRHYQWLRDWEWV